MPQRSALGAGNRGAGTDQLMFHKPRSHCGQWHTRYPSPALPSRRHSPPVSPSLGPGVPVQKPSPTPCPPCPCLPVSPIFSLPICFLPLPSRRRSLSLSPRLSPTPPPPLPAPPRPWVSLCHWLRPGDLVTAPRQAPHSPLPGGEGRGGSGRGRVGGVATPFPTSQAPGAERWPGRGRAGFPGARVPAPGPGPPGPGPDGLHREPGVLRGAGARGPLRPPALGESPGPGAG